MLYCNYAKYFDLFYRCNSFVLHRQPKSESAAIYFSAMLSTFFIENEWHLPQTEGATSRRLRKLLYSQEVKMWLVSG